MRAPLTAGYSRPLGKECCPTVLWRLRHNTAGPNILAANQPQPIDPLLVRELDALTPLAHHAPNAIDYSPDS
jgi:hypothetical protein